MPGWLKVLLGMVLAGVLAPLSGQEPSPAETRTRIAILPLQGEGAGHFGKPEDELLQRVTTAFLRTRRFELVERQRLASLLEEAKFQNVGLVDDATAVKLGKLLGVQRVIVGSYRGEIIAYYGDATTSNPLFRWFTGKVTLGLRMVDVGTGSISDTFDASGAEKDSTVAKTLHGILEDLTRKLEREIGNRYPLAGIVIREEPDKLVMVDLGKKDGLKVGDPFQVVVFGEDAVHPVTGKLIRGPRKVLAELSVASVDEESCLMKVRSRKEPLRPGYLVESVAKKAGFFEKFMDKVIK